MKSSRTTAGLLFAVLVLVGLGTSPLERNVWESLRSQQPALDLSRLEDALGQGLTVALLGGFRALAANLLWLQTNLAWEQYDLPRTQTMVRIVTTVDPRPLFFWQNGARMIAYDMPNWRYDDLGGIDRISPELRREIEHQQSAIALRLLETALEYHPQNPLVYVEIANIHLRRLGDLEAAALYYGRASHRPDTPHYAPRIFAELLRRVDRPGEALEFLRQLHPTLDRNDPFAMPDVVLGRIRELEESLGLLPEERYQPPL